MSGMTLRAGFWWWDAPRAERVAVRAMDAQVPALGSVRTADPTTRGTAVSTARPRLGIDVPTQRIFGFRLRGLT